MDWLNNLNKAIDYIEDNLDKEISYEKCAKLAGFSKFYFQRIFSYITSISLSEYIRRRKMTQAGFDLQKNNSRVIDIALKYGYNSPTSFTRAFKSIHNITPSEAKKYGAVLNSYPRINFSVNISGDEPMNYKIKLMKEFKIIGIKVNLTDDVVENQKIVPKFWKKTLNNPIFREICSLNNTEPKGILGITVYKSPEEIYYYIGVASNEKTPNNMSSLTIPESNWVIFENNEDFKDGTIKIFNNFYSQWLIFSNYQYNFLPDIEIYPMDPKITKSQVLISIKNKE